MNLNNTHEPRVQRRLEQRSRTAGFTQSGTANKLNDVNINRKDTRTHLSMLRKTVCTSTDKREYAKAEGLMKIRDLHLKAGILTVPYSEYEMKRILIEARDCFTEDGVLPVDIELKLSAAGYVVEELTTLWSLMDKAEVDTSVLAETPLNTFGEGEETAHG